MHLNKLFYPASSSRTLSAATLSSQDIAAGAQAVNRSFVAALAFLTYDILITLDQEVSFVWTRPWSFMKVNYFFVRYIPLLVQIPLLFVGSELTPHFHFTSHACFIWQVYQGVASILILSSLDYILIARIYVLHYHQRVVKIIVGIAYVVEIIMMCVGLGLALPEIGLDSNCVVISVPPVLLVYAGAYVVFQTLIFALTFYRFVVSIRAGWGDIPIIRLLMKDGTWAFFVLFIEMISQASLYGLKNTAYAGVLYGWLLTASSFCGYRVFLNISQISVSNDISYTSYSTPMHFTSNFPGTNDIETGAP